MSEATLYAPRPRTARAPLALGIVVALELLVFVLAIALGVRGLDVLVLVLALVTTLVGALPILLDAARPAERRQLFISLTALGYVTIFVPSLFTQYFPMKGEVVPGTFSLTQHSPMEIAHAQLVALAGLLALLVGFYSPFGRIAASVVPKPVRDWSPRATLAVSVITLFLGWLVYLAGQVGAFPTRAGSGILGTIATGSHFGIVIVTLAWLRHRRREALWLLAIVLPLAMGINFFTGSKRLFLTPLFMVALSYIVYERRVRASWVIAGFALLIVLYPVSNFYREAVWVPDGSRLRVFLENPGEVLRALGSFTGSADAGSYISSGLAATGSRLDGLGVLTVIVRDTPDRVPYQGGWTVGLSFLMFVPRLLWPNKPKVTIGEWVSQSYGSPYDLYTDVGPTWIGEFFFNWGHAGVVLGMLVLGVSFRMFQERLFQWNAPIPALFAAVGLLYVITRSVQGALLDPLTGPFFVFAPIVVAHLFVGLTGGYQPVPTAAPPEYVQPGGQMRGRPQLRSES